MYGLIVTGIFSVVALFLRIIQLDYLDYQKSEIQPTAVVFLILFLLMVIIGLVYLVGWLIYNFIESGDQRDSLTNLRANKEKQRNIKEKISAITPILKAMVDAYSEHEKGIFERILNDKGNLTTAAAHFPDLKNDGIVQLQAQTLVNCYDELCELQNRYQKLLAEANFRRVNPWLLRSLIDEVPADLAEPK